MLGATTSLEVQTPEGVSFRLPIASPFSRCLAMAIDFAVILALTVLLFQILSILGNMLTHIPVIGRVVSDLSSGLLIILQFLIGIGYGIACEWLLRGQTVGKRMMKLRVIDERGLTLRFSQVAIRNLFRLLDILPSTFYLLGGISCFLTKRCQRLGDIAAGTLVVREVPRFVRPRSRASPRVDPTASRDILTWRPVSVKTPVRQKPGSPSTP